MLSVDTDVAVVKGASRRRCGDTARNMEVKVRDECAAVGARKSDVDVIKRRFSTSAWKWHMHTDGG